MSLVLYSILPILRVIISEVLTYGNLEFSLVKGSSLLVSDVETDWGDVEALLLILLTLLGFRGLLLGPFRHLGSTEEFTLDLDLVLHVLAGFSELSLTLNLDFQIFLEKSLTKNNELVAVGVLRSVVLSFEFQAAIFLGLGVLGLRNSITKSLEGFGGLGKILSSLIGSISGSSTEVESAAGLGSLEDVLDGGWVGLGEEFLDTTCFFWGLDGSSLTDQGNSNDLSV